MFTLPSRTCSQAGAGVLFSPAAHCCLNISPTPHVGIGKHPNMKIPPSFSFLKQLSTVIAAFFLTFATLTAQVPQNIPSENTDLDWSSWANWLMFVILPLAMLFFFIFWKRLKSGRDED